MENVTANQKLMDEFYNFGMKIGAKLRNPTTPLYKIQLALRRENKIDLIHEFLMLVNNVNTSIPSAMSDFVVGCLKEEEDIKHFYPFIAGVQNGSLMTKSRG